MILGSAALQGLAATPGFPGLLSKREKIGHYAIGTTDLDD